MTRHEQQSSVPPTPSTVLSPAATISPTATASTDKMLEVVLDKARQASKAGCWLEVIQHCEAAIAQCHEHLSNEHDSKPTVEAADSNSLSQDSLSQDLGEFHQVKGELFRREGKIDKAIEAYQQALQYPLGQSQPARSKLCEKLADLYAQQKQWTCAVEQYEQALSLSPEEAKLQHKLDQAQIQLDEEKLARNPEDVKLRRKLSKAYFAASQRLNFHGMHEEAGWACLKALGHNPRFESIYVRLRHAVIPNLKVVHSKPRSQSLLAQIIITCRQIVKQHPDLIIAHSILGYALTHAGYIKEASKCYQHSNLKVAHQHLEKGNAVDGVKLRGPDFIIIGAQKSGTTAFYKYLSHHPQIIPPVEKEINFFTAPYSCDLDWYLSNFPPLPEQGGWMTGDVSPNYLYGRLAPQRVYQHFPDIKLGVLLRNPIDRAVSLYQMQARTTQQKFSFAEIAEREMKMLRQAMEMDELSWKVLDHCPHLGRSLYVYHLQRWLSFFPREQIFVIQSENLLNQTDQVLEKFYAILGLDHHSEPSYQKHHVGQYQPIDDKLHQTLDKFFAPHNCKLEDLLGCSFNW